MKNFKKILAVLLTGGSLLLSNSALASRGNGDSTGFLLLNGRVIKSSVKEKGGYTVELLQNEVVVSTQTVKAKREFLLDLKKNQKYTLRVSKEGFLPFVIDIDTHSKKAINEFYRFDFDTQLIPLQTASSFEKNSSGEAIALLRHDAYKDVFYPIEYKGQVSALF